MSRILSGLRGSVNGRWPGRRYWKTRRRHDAAGWQHARRGPGSRGPRDAAVGLARRPSAEGRVRTHGFVEGVQSPIVRSASEPSANSCRYTVSYFSDRQSRSMNTLSKQRPRQSRGQRTPVRVETLRPTSTMGRKCVAGVCRRVSRPPRRTGRHSTRQTGLNPGGTMLRYADALFFVLVSAFAGYGPMPLQAF